MNLLIDMGNTRLKWATEADGQWLSHAAVNNDQLSPELLVKVWQSLPRPSRLAISQVSSNQLQDLIRDAAARLWPGLEISIWKSAAWECGVSNAYQAPELLGVDRWLALIGAYHHFPGPACIIDCGTAITVDVINATGVHLGGWISPGLKLMRTALAQGTSRLELSPDRFEFGLGTHTGAGIYNGTLAAAAGLIEYALNRYPGYRLLMTGGDAELISRQLSVPAEIDADLVLRGLAIAIRGDP